MKNLTDDELVAGYESTQNQGYIAEFFLRYSDAAYRTALQFTRHTADAEDAVQISFIKCLRDFNQYQKGTNLKAWLMRIVVNTCKDKYREEKRRSARHEKYGETKDKLTMEIDQAEKEELQAMVRKSVTMLPEKYRAPIWMVLYEGFSYPEVATVLDLPEKTVRTQVARGIDRLKEILSSFGAVLSVDGISMLAQQSTLEAIPEATKKLLESPQFLQTAQATEILKSTETYSTLSTGLSYYKLFSFFIFSGILIAGGIYFFPQSQTGSQISQKVIAKPASKINQSWDFKDSEARKLPLLSGKWEWSEKFQGMLQIGAPPIMISLPVINNDEPILIENTVIVNGSPENPILGLSAFWVKDNYLLRCESFPRPETYREKQGQKLNQKTYIYQNYIVGFIGDKPIQIIKYSVDLTGASLVILSQSYVFQKISCQNYDGSLDRVKKIIQNIKTSEGRDQAKHFIQPNSFNFVD